MAKQNWLVSGIITGVAGAAATTAAIAVFGKTKDGSAWTPFNGISHMLFGEKAADVDGFAPKETLTGLGLNAGAVTTWGVIYEKVAGQVPFPQSLATAAVASAVIYTLDYHVLPERLRPGFEKRTGGDAVLATYILLALSMGLSPLWKKAGTGGGEGADDTEENG